MLLAIDIGNSNIVFGIFEGKNLKESWRIRTIKENDKEYYREQLADKTNLITQVVIGSVVPELDDVFDSVSRDVFATKPLFISTELTTGIKNLTNEKSELGADLLADIAAAINLYSNDKIVIDLGTASKFLAISKSDEYVGGAIGPGIGSSFESLIKGASKLGDLKLSQPEKVVATFTTEEHLNSGFVYGFSGMTDGMVVRMIDELAWSNPTIILTGGFSDMIAPHLHTKVIVNKNLTLYGLQMLWEENQKNNH
jgi:type III pantothenate kinase